MKLIHAYTQETALSYPGFMNLSRYDTGGYKLSVRTPGLNGVMVASLDMDTKQLTAMMDAVAGCVPPTSGAPYGIIDPDYARVYSHLRCLAWSYGFGCMMHGSFTRDLDVILVPWEKHASMSAVEGILKMLCADCDLRMSDGWTTKEHGRLQRSLYFNKFGDHRWIDFSVMPCTKEPAKDFVEREEPDSI